MKTEVQGEVKLHLYIYHLLNYNELDSAFLCHKTAERIFLHKNVWVREVGNYQMLAFLDTLDDLSETCVSMTGNQIELIMTMPAYEDLSLKRQ